MKATNENELEGLGATPGITYCKLREDVVATLLQVKNTCTPRLYNALCGAVVSYYMTGTEPVLSKNAMPYWIPLRFSIESTRSHILSQKPQLNSISGMPSGNASGMPSGNASGMPSGRGYIYTNNYNYKHLPQPNSTEEEPKSKAEAFFDATQRHTDRP